MNQNQKINEIQKLNFLRQNYQTLDKAISKGQIGLTIGRDIQDILQNETPVNPNYPLRMVRYKVKNKWKSS